MTLRQRAERSATAPRAPLRAHAFEPLFAFFDATLAIVEMEIHKLRHDPTELFTRALQPALWLVVFGEVFTKTHAIPSDNLSYKAFMAPGVLAQSVMFIAIFYGISLIWERDLGIVHKFLASPAPRPALVLGKALAAGVRALAQAVIVYAIALFMAIEINWSPLAVIGVVVFVLLGAVLFSTFSLVIACLVRTRERFMGIGQVLTMPLFFASSAIYPISVMPGWLKALALINPLTYEVDGLRALMPQGGSSSYGLGFDFAVLALVSAALIVLASWLYPRAAQ